MNWLDYVILLIIVASAWQGLRTGLIIGVARLLGLVLGFVVAFAGYRPLAAYLDTRLGWGDTVSSFLLERLPLPTLEGLGEKLSLAPNLNDLLLLLSIEGKSGPAREMTESVNALAGHLALSLLELLSFMALVIIVSLLVSITLRMFSGAVSHTFLSPVNHLGGLVLGMARGLLIVGIALLLLQPFMPADANLSRHPDNFWGRALSGSVIIPRAIQVLDGLNLRLPLQPVTGDQEEVNRDNKRVIFKMLLPGGSGVGKISNYAHTGYNKEA